MDRADHQTHAGGDDQLGVVVVAAGRSSRMGGTDKTFTEVQGAPLIVHTLRRLAASEVVEAIALVVAAEAVPAAQTLARRFGVGKITSVCAGGARRQDSVYAGLLALGQRRWVAIHDGARPCVAADMLTRGLDAVRSCNAAIAAVPVKDTIKVVGDAGLITHTPERAALWAAQTPQLFEYRLLLEAHRNAHGDFTDDASMVEAAGHPVRVFWGNYDNLKVTTPEDLAIVDRLIAQQAGSNSANRQRTYLAAAS